MLIGMKMLYICAVFVLINKPVTSNSGDNSSNFKNSSSEGSYENDDDINGSKTFVEGVQCDIKNYPYMVQISSDGRTTTCTGTLMATKVVITAASCIKNSMDTVLIFHRNKKWYGWNERPSTKREVTVHAKRCCRHKHYKVGDKDSLFDIAICILKKDLPQAAPLHVFRHRHYSGDFREHCANFVSVGWNSLKADSDEMNCMKGIVRYNPMYCLDEGHYLCTERLEEKGGGALGGPLICGNIVVAIWKGQRRHIPPHANESNLISIWTKTYRHQEFINNAIKGYFYTQRDPSGSPQEIYGRNLFCVFLTVLFIFVW